MNWFSFWMMTKEKALDGAEMDNVWKGGGQVMECITKVSQRKQLVINASLVHYTNARAE